MQVVHKDNAISSSDNRAQVPVEYPTDVHSIVIVRGTCSQISSCHFDLPPRVLTADSAKKLADQHPVLFLVPPC